MFNRAALTKDPVERMKCVITGTIAYFYFEKIFEKPLNPILGETFEAYGQDGSKIYMEQTCHHPPISHMYVDGPDQNYIMTGWSSYTINAGMNSATLTADGHKLIKFEDGCTIRCTNTNDLIYNIFMGTMGHQLAGSMEFHDEKNDVHATYTFGNIRRMAQDFFSGEIT